MVLKKICLLLTLKLISNITGVAIILFFSAGKLHYKTSLVFVILFTICALLYAIVMLFKHPDLLKKRLIYKENNTYQQIVIVLSLIICIAILLAAGFTYRNDWLCLPVQRYYVSVGLFIVATTLYFNVIKENLYLTSEITVQDGQRVIQTGPYKIVRHPMYTAMILFMLSADFVLGSILSLVLSLLFIPVLIMRIINEEKMLKQELTGYIDYTKKVKYRLIPYLW